MNLEQLEKANAILKEIEEVKENIIGAKYTQSEDIPIRETYLKVNGLASCISVPESLFRVVGKLILAENQLRLIELEKQFEAL